uniref:Uncharacterized protein n=1 Tax=Amphimedon queenslandica TaxID=400682 RepID=A0A1X7TFF4_AMPQE
MDPVYEEVSGDIPELMAEQPRAKPAQTRAKSWQLTVRDAFKRKDHEEAVRLLRLKDPIVPLHRRDSNLLHYSISNGWLDVTKDLIINHSFSPQYCYYDGECYLYTAAKGNHVNVVEYLIKECGCDPMMLTSDNEFRCRQAPVLHYVTSKGLLDVLQCMVKNINGHIMDKQYRDTNGQTVLHLALKHIDVLKYLINECNCDLRTPDKSGNTILHVAANERLLDVIKYLISTHPYPMTTNNSGQIGALKRINVVKYLINKCNFDIMITDEYGVSFLHYVASEGLLDVLKCMVMNTNGHIMDKQYRDTSGLTVLHYAVKHIDIVKYLINECNCDLRTPDKYKNTILHVAANERLLNVIKYLISTHPYPMTTNNSGQIGALKRIDVVKYLINKCNFDIMITDEYGVSFLHYVASEGLLDVLKCMVMNINGHIMDKQYHDTNGRTVLHFAVKHTDAVNYLIHECNCDIMITDKDGIPFLHHVVAEGLLDALKCMVINTNGHIMDKQYRDTSGLTVLHYAVKHIDIVKYLIFECNCNIMVTDNHGQTPLHAASAKQGTNEVIEYLLLTGSCDPLARDNEGMTPMQLAIKKQNSSVIAIFKKCGDIKISHPIDSYVNVLLVGNPGAGKSTLSHVINDTANRSFVLSSFRNVKGVEPCTAGIIPYKLQHRELGNIILHDFAGHSEYYSSHSAVIENLLHGSGGVFLVVVNILEKEAVKQLHQWLTVVRNEAQKALTQCHVIVIVSHVDEILKRFDRKKRKEEIKDIIIRESCDCIFLDCRKLGGSGTDFFFNKLSSACESIRSASGRNLSLYCHMMYGLLEKRKENILTLSDLTSAGENDDYVIPDNEEDSLDILCSLHSTGLISVLKSEDRVWVVVNKGVLLTEVDGILFAPKTFKEYVDIASNTGIVSVSGLNRLFPKYDPDMLICFLKNMELCQELNPSFLRMTNLIPEDRNETGDNQRKGESNRPKKMTSQAYQFGWCLQCTKENDFFLPRYFHILSLHFAFKMAQPQEGDKLKRRCTFWKNGLYWSNGRGVGSLVEIVDESQCVLVMMSCEEGYCNNMVSLRRDVIGEVMSVYKESCPSLEVKELVIDPKELAYPVDTPRERTVHSVKDILSAIDKREDFLVDATGTTRTKLKEILPDESLSSNLSLLGGREIKEVIKINKGFITAITIKQESTSQKVKPATDYSPIQITPPQISESNDNQQKGITKFMLFIYLLI